MKHVSLNNPPAIFKDVTMDLREMIADIDDAKISVIMRTCDNNVLPTVLCPWGESEFLHTCGDVPFDSVLQWYMKKCYFKKFQKTKIVGKFIHPGRIILEKKLKIMITSCLILLGLSVHQLHLLKEKVQLFLRVMSIMVVLINYMFVLQDNRDILYQVKR